ncbi:MAG TPA: FeoB-associated Cys-rich membrane protein [Pyrinomonadaceae bacterium]|jgi:hypothetical protein
MIDWQTLIVALIILAAVVYAGRRAWSRLRALSASRASQSSCETGCGSCQTSTQARPAQPQRTVFVEISRTRKPSQQ